MNRTSRKTLDSLVTLVNKTLGRPETSYVQQGDRYVAQIGNIHLDHNIGGYQLEEMHNESGGVTTPFGCRRLKAVEMEEKLRTILDTLRIVGKL